MVTNQDIKERRKSYFHRLFNEGHNILLYYDRLNTRKEGQNYTFCHRIQEREVKETLKMMDNCKAVRAGDIPVEVWKNLGQRGISWLTIFQRDYEV